jgi:hypothetical protein
MPVRFTAPHFKRARRVHTTDDFRAEARTCADTPSSIAGSTSELSGPLELGPILIVSSQSGVNCTSNTCQKNIAYFEIFSLLLRVADYSRDGKANRPIAGIAGTAVAVCLPGLFSCIPVDSGATALA